MAFPPPHGNCAGTNQEVTATFIPVKTLATLPVLAAPLALQAMGSSWDNWVDEALNKLASKNLLRSLRSISLPVPDPSGDQFKTFDSLQPWDRSSVEVNIEESTFQNWLQEVPCQGDVPSCTDGGEGRQLLLFSGNDYLGLSSHPAVRNAASKAAQEHGMGPRGSALICGYTNYHRQLESMLAELKKKEDSLLCPTGFAANMAVMTSLGSLSSILSADRKPSKDERVAIFSDALNHASIIDGIRIAERQKEAEVFVYRHCDMIHLDTLLSRCTWEKKVVVTDSLFSMDGDFAPMRELVQLRKKHNFLLVIDDAHATFICGKNGGGTAELYDCENDVDICVGTLSKAGGCQGGFIACSKKWKQLMQSRGRSFIFSTALPVPIVAAAHAALVVAKKEKWRRTAIWDRVQEFAALTRLCVTSPIISLVIGSEEAALRASRHMLEYGFHVTAIRPPTVPSNSCRLRVTLSSAHTTNDIEMLAAALSHCIKFPVVDGVNTREHSKL